MRKMIVPALAALAALAFASAAFPQDIHYRDPDGLNSVPVSAANPLPVTGIVTDSTPVAQGSTTSGQSGPLVQCATTTAAPTYITAKTNPLSCDTAGNARVATDGTFASTASVRGPTVDAQLASLFPVNVGTQYNSTSPTYTTGQQASFQVDSRGNLVVKICGGSGNVNCASTLAGIADGASNVATGLLTYAYGGVFSGSNWDKTREVINGQNSTGTGLLFAGIGAQCDDTTPTALTENSFGQLREDCTAHSLVVGGVYTTTASTLTTGTAGPLQTGNTGSLKVQIMAGDSNTSVATKGTNADGQSTASTVNAAFAMCGVFNGTTWDRCYSGAGAATQGNAGVGNVATEEAGKKYTNITTATTTTVKSGAGTFGSLCYNTYVASATVTIYDNTTATGTKIATITLPSTITALGPTCVQENLGFNTGLTIITSGATDLTVGWR